VQIRLDRLEEKHTSGLDEQGRRWKIRGAPVGALVEAGPGRKQTARRQEVLEAAPDQIAPVCPVFGVCGGCQLQEMPLDSQRQHKQEFVTRTVLENTPDPGVHVHPVRGAPQGLGYRNKIELSFGTRQYLAQVPETGPPAPGSFLGFHPPGWYSKIVDLAGCPLANTPMNQVIEALRAEMPGPAWDTMGHHGHWRHLVVRDAGLAGEPRVVVSLVTTSTVDEAQVRSAAERIAQLPGVYGIAWVVNDGVAEVATGELREVLHGSTELHFQVAGLDLRLPHDAFFQVNTAGAEVLVQTLAEAAGSGGSLVDLYCGSGLIGMALAKQFEQVIGIELHEGAIECARKNAAANGISGKWLAGKVEEILPTLELPAPRTVIVDPPRVGLHPKVARTLAGLEMDRLVYVACKPASMQRDAEILAEGGWRLEELWTVDLFPQTHHVEAVGRFTRRP
jgi:23S rRNA (uracil1939-C5)-methyltransferase